MILDNGLIESMTFHGVKVVGDGGSTIRFEFNDALQELLEPVTIKYFEGLTIRKDEDNQYQPSIYMTDDEKDTTIKRYSFIIDNQSQLEIAYTDMLTRCVNMTIKTIASIVKQAPKQKLSACLQDFEKFYSNLSDSE